ncbi:DUF1493 family protein [Brenneria corticis]|uniref:Cytoplasmic protein n=1 Tax=Brenneria corticis TaxID=2173106 RepID=A0A2U1TME6_9GAMM|nr:DUF1493 family protein [Brenneria sp. CFCC 11842]PWC10502.1 cytoplasmic protein [Brenneria sp. CFCC 11842]
MVTDEDVLSFFKEEISTLATLTFKTIPLELDTVLQEYAEGDELYYAIDKYGETFGVDMSRFNWDNYYPWRDTPFWHTWFSKKPVENDKTPLTIRMFSESAKSGRWLYD